jgi:hypothetical protein
VVNKKKSFSIIDTQALRCVVLDVDGSVAEIEGVLGPMLLNFLRP